MEMASFSGLVKTLLWIVCIYYALKFLMRLLAPYLFQEMVKKAGQNFQQHQQQYQNQQQSQQNQQQTSNFEKPQEKKKVGEYIDFEEIE
jgi:predicted lipid-binding transport protein (Tim44 family)